MWYERIKYHYIYCKQNYSRWNVMECDVNRSISAKNACVLSLITDGTPSTNGSIWAFVSTHNRYNVQTFWKIVQYLVSTISGIMDGGISNNVVINELQHIY